MLHPNTMICGCLGVQDDVGKWLCPEGHEFVEALMAGELIGSQVRSRMATTKRERAHLTLSGRRGYGGKP